MNSSTNNANMIAIVTGSPLLGPTGALSVGGTLPSANASTTSVANVSHIRVLSLNIWGIFNSNYRKQRLSHFASKIDDYDVICLQEQFGEEDFRTIMEHVPHPLRSQLYTKRFPSSFIGSGLAVISKFEIRHTQYFAYPTQSHPEKVYHGDCYARKGVAMVRLSVPFCKSGEVRTSAASSGRQGCTEITVYTTHLVAAYEKVSRLGSFEREMYAAYRISQALSLASFICSSSRPWDNIILCGDFNAAPSSPEMKLLLATCHCRGGIEFVRTLVDDDVTNFTYSFENAFNTDSSSYLKFMEMQEDIPVQLDHIFFSGNNLNLVPAEVPNLVDVSPMFHSHNSDVATGVVVFTNNKEVPTGDVKFPTCPMSDHYGLCARFSVSPPVVPPTLAYGPLSARMLASESFASSRPPTLVVDPTSHRKALEFSASFLGRSSHQLQLQATKFMRWALMLLIVPLMLSMLLRLIATPSTTATEGTSSPLLKKDGFENMLAFLVDVVCLPPVMFMLGAACTVLLIVAKLQRGDDAIVMGAQAEELRDLIDQFDWS
jgi:endonuclease/exonuclease/phosphatase family metal-dependent hydrolase